MAEGAALTEIAFEPVSSNRSLRCGKRHFQGRDKEAKSAPEIRGRRSGEIISLGNSATLGRTAGFREISVRPRMRGGLGSPCRTRLHENFPDIRKIQGIHVSKPLFWRPPDQILGET